MNKPNISVIIPVYNGANYVGEAIESVRKQTYKDYEIIVVNDGSNDDGKTEAVLADYSNDIRYLKKENGGVATALNLGIREMSGRYFLWLSHDDLLKPDTLQVYMDCLKELNEDTILWGNYDLINGDSQVYGMMDFKSYMSEADLQMSVYPVISGMVNACTVLIHKSHFDRVGGFDEKLKIAQDNEMLFRIFRGQKTHFCRDILASKRYHDKQDSVTKNIFPEEDEFIAQAVESLSFSEVSKFTGCYGTFYRQIMLRFDDGKHPKTVGICRKRIENEQQILMSELVKLDKKELEEMVGEINSRYTELYKKYEELNWEYKKNCTVLM